MTPQRKDLIRYTLLWWTGASLRVTILAVPPLILAISDELHLSATEIGLLTGLPIAMFALAAVPGSLLIARLGSRLALVWGLVIIAAGAALRGGAWSVGLLYGATAIMGAGVAITQSAMPVVVRQWLPARIGFATAIYSNGLLVSEIIAVSLTPALVPLLGGSWRAGLAIWAVPVGFTALAVSLFPRTPGEERPQAANPHFWWPDWHNPLIWRLGLLFGCVNATYFASNAFLPAHLKSAGAGDLIQPALTWLNFGQVPASLLIAGIARQVERRAWPFWASGAAMTLSVAGIVYTSGSWLIVSAGLLGFSIAAALILGLTLPALLASPKDVGRTSAAMFTLSYSLGVGVAFLCGAVSDMTGSAAAAFIPIAVCTVVLSVSALGLRATGRLV